MTAIQIRQIRGNLTRKDFSALLGVTETYLYMIETERRRPSKSLMLLLLRMQEGKKKK